MKKKISAVLAALLAGSILSAAPANADYVGDGCVQDPFLYGMRWTSRLICDEPIQADGSWLRHRGFFADSYYKSMCYTYWCEGRVVPELKIIDHYVVTQDTVLPDEPGHIQGG